MLALTLPLLVSCFNPRTRDGCEEAGVYECLWRPVSIHAPVMGAKLPPFL